MGLSLQLASGARTPPISSGKGSGAARATKVSTPGSALPRACGRWPSAGRQPKSKHGLPN
jgi:hypothetical protein